MFLNGTGKNCCAKSRIIANNVTIMDYIMLIIVICSYDNARNVNILYLNPDNRIFLDFLSNRMLWISTSILTNATNTSNAMLLFLICHIFFLLNPSTGAPKNKCVKYAYAVLCSFSNKRDIFLYCCTDASLLLVYPYFFLTLL